MSRPPTADANMVDSASTDQRTPVVPQHSVGHWVAQRTMPTTICSATPMSSASVSTMSLSWHACSACNQREFVWVCGCVCVCMCDTCFPHKTTDINQHTDAQCCLSVVLWVKTCTQGTHSTIRNTETEYTVSKLALPCSTHRIEVSVHYVLFKQQPWLFFQAHTVQPHDIGMLQALHPSSTRSAHRPHSEYCIECIY